MKRTLPLIATLASLLAVGTVHAQDLLYVLERSATLPSTDTGWDYAKMEPGTSRLHIARDGDGNTVFDVDANRAIATVGNSKGANGPLLIPQHDRGYVAMTDGSLLSFSLKTLKPIARLPLAKDGGLNSGIFDPATDRIHMIVGSRPTESTWFTLDARTLSETGRWPVPCNVSKVRFQARTKLLLAACVGENPSFLAIDAESGAIVASLPIGNGIDGFVVDEKRGRIIASSGTDAVLTVIGQSGRAFRPLGSVSTRPGARMMTIDDRTGKLLVITADYTLPPAGADGESPSKSYHPDSFTVLTYAPR
jgi:hypothetical protein